MPQNFPGVYVEETTTAARAIAGVPTSVTAFIGWSAQGPVDEAVPCSSFEDFRAHFGELDPRAFLGYAVQHFFLNGGTRAWVLRLAAIPSDTPLAPGTEAFSNALMGRSGSRGYRLLDALDPINIVAVPGHAKEEDLVELQAYCRQRRAFLLIDAAPEATFDALKTGPPAALTGAHAANSAFYFPWIQAPDAAQHGALRMFPPSGAVAGIYARTDTARGVWKAPAGTDVSILWATGVQQALTPQQNAVLNPVAVNCIRTLPAHGVVVWGARTLAGADGMGSEWKYVPVRRTVLFIEESLYRGLRWVVFETNGQQLWADLHARVTTFLHELFRQGALQGQTDREAYFVQCGTGTMTQSDIDSGIVNIEVGVALLKPAEFVILRIQQMAGQDTRGHATLRRVEANGTWEELATSAPETTQRSLRDAVARARETKRKGTTVLFDGPRGTGKTLAAGVVATSLGLSLYRVDLSQLVSKYTGETEKNLDRVLQAAAGLDAVLLFDEADALFGTRTDVHDSHDRYANQELSYLLQRLEEYAGVVIVATNTPLKNDDERRTRFRFVVPFSG